MVCHFVSDSHEVMTALIVVLPLIVVVEISLQLHRSFMDEAPLSKYTPDDVWKNFTVICQAKKGSICKWRMPSALNALCLDLSFCALFRAMCDFVWFTENCVILLVLPSRSKRIHVLLPHTKVKLTTSSEKERTSTISILFDAE
jgi:hypothetical protein